MKNPRRYKAAIISTLMLLIWQFATGVSALQAASIDWEGWKFEYSTSNNSSGLVLTNVQHNDEKVLNKVSLPVMRVRYDNDVCGPYADILSSRTLSVARAGAPASACDNQSVCKRSFTLNGEKMLEVGSNWQIGEYQIYQTYYFSENGYFDARVYSRGLQCNINHSHHAHWMFDFDIDGEQNDQVVLANGTIPATEFNDQKANTSNWTIRDRNTGKEVTLSPSAEDGQPTDFARWDVAVRAYRSSEVGYWRLGSRGEIGENYLNQESVDDDDIVFWYVTHLPHAASEGPDLWHASGPRITVDDATSETGTEPGTGTGPEPEPEPPADPDNLLTDGGFDGTLTGWFSCGPEGNTGRVTENTHTGAGAVALSQGGCLYQETSATVAEYYTLSCQALQNGSLWAVMELSFIDANYERLSSEVIQIRESSNYQNYVAGLLAPENTAFALAVLYSESETQFDTCILSPGDEVPPIVIEPPAPGDNLLANGSFESDLGGWFTCAQTDLPQISQDSTDGDKALSINNGGCLYQEFPIQGGQNYTLQCDAKSNGSLYSSMTLEMVDSSYASLERNETPVSSNTYAPYTSQLAAPPDSEIGVVVVYAEDPSHFDNCEVSSN